MIERGAVGKFAWRALAVVGALALVAGTTGCGDDDNGGGGDGTESGNNTESSSGCPGPDVVDFADLLVSPANTQVSTSGAVGATDTYTLTVQSVGGGVLEVAGVALDITPAPADAASAAFQVTEVRACRESQCANAVAFSPDSLSADNVIRVRGSNEELWRDDDFLEVQVDVTFTLPEGSSDQTAILRVISNADGAGANAQGVLTTAVSLARIEVAPLIVNFDFVPADTTDTKIIGINNAGSGTLNVNRLEFQGSDYFKLLVGEGDAQAEYSPGGSIELTDDELISLAPNESGTIQVRFEPLDGDPATGSVRIFSNDANEPPNGTLVELRGNTSGPCIQLNPVSKLTFGGQPVGVPVTSPVQVINCGNAPLEIYEIFLREESSLDFITNFESLADLPEGPSDENPLIIPINGSANVGVRYVPDEVNPKDEEGIPVPDLGTLVFRNNTFEQDRELEVEGFGVEGNCPVATITVLPGEEVIPQTVLQLSGDQSFSNEGDIVAYEWEVEQPDGNQQALIPSNEVSNLTLAANVAGEYNFFLRVQDSTGKWSCNPEQDQSTVVVIPTEAIHVELTWTTPNDPDPTDEGAGKGADLDLHFAHPFASSPDLDGDGLPDPWFDTEYDTFWANPTPEWASFSSEDDNPSLDRDDTDGAGPENLNLNVPEDGVSYRMAAHYWNDHGFGQSLASVRVYIYASLVWEEVDVLLGDLDMWEIGTVNWPEGNVTPNLTEEGELKITPDYVNPFFFQPTD